MTTQRAGQPLTVQAKQDNFKIRPGDPTSVPEQRSASWALAIRISWGNIKRRLFRSAVTMTGIVLAVSFLTYMLINDNVVDALIQANNDALNILLQKAGVDIYAVGATDQMTALLILLSLLTCLAGIINSMLMAVTERVREIGTLKCLGALDGFIIQNYLIESTIQGLVGTLIGLVVGLAVSALVLVNAYGGFVFEYFPWLLTVRTLLLAFAIGVVLSVAASILPAYRAARMQPVDAMRVQE